MFTLLALAIAPTIFILVFILRRDHNEKEPRPLLANLFLVGALATIPAAFLEAALEPYVLGFPIALPDPLFRVAAAHSLAPIALYCFCVVGVVEEGAKYLVVRFLAWNRPCWDEVFDGVIYCVCASLGMATLENIVYVFEGGVGTSIVRALLSVPAHAMFAVVMGYNMSMSKTARGGARRFRHGLLSFFGPVAGHGLFDFLLLSQNGLFLLVFVPYVILLYARTWRLIKHAEYL